MEKGGYQSLLKSFSKGRPPPASASEGQKSSPKPPPKTVEELMAGAKAKNSEVLQGDGISRPTGGRQPIGRIISGVKIPVGRQGLGIKDQMARKPIADILEDSSKIRSLSSRASDQSQITLPEDTVIPQPLATEAKQLISPNDKDKEDNVATLSMKSRRDVFNFAIPTSLTRSKSVSAVVPIVRSNMLFDYLNDNFSQPTPATMYEHKLLDTEWKYGFAFDAMVNTVETDTCDLSTVTNAQCQTERVNIGYRWTQQPPTLQKPSVGTQVNGYQIFLDLEGVSTDPPAPFRDKSIAETPAPANNWATKQEDSENEMLKFTKKSSELMLSILSSKSVHQLSPSTPLEFGRGLSHLQKLTMHALHCDGHLIACANAPRKDPAGKGPRQDGKNIVTVWSVNQPLNPKYFLRVHGEVTKIKMELTTQVIVVGTYYGCLNIYDLREEERIHNFFQGICVRNPTFHSGCTDDDSHASSIIGIQILTQSKTTTQIVSLDKDNLLICWSCMHLRGGDKEDLSGNTAAASNLRVRVRQVIRLAEMILGTDLLSCNCLTAWEGDVKYFLVGTNNGFVAKGRITSIQFENYSKETEKFYGESDDTLIRILYIDLNVKLGLFLAVCDDKNIRLFDFSRQMAIQCFECDEIPMKILWSRRRLSVFYVPFQDEVAIWDIVISDLNPVKEFPTNGLLDFELVQVGTLESMAMIVEKGVKLIVVPPPCDLSPLNGKDEEVLRHYISIIN